MLLLRQIQTLIWKNFLISTLRHPISTPLRAFIFPVIFAWVSIEHGFLYLYGTVMTFWILTPTVSFLC